MADGSPTLEVGFEIQTGGSYDELQRLQAVMNSTEGKMLAAAGQIEQATRDMVGQTATTNVTTFGNASTRAMQTAARETANAEKAGERLVAQLERQTSTFGKTSSEIRTMNAEMRATAASSQGLTELAGRIRGAEAEMQRLESTAKNMPGASNGAKYAMQNFGFQAQDFAVQVAGGTSALRAFAQQFPQAAGALSGFEGKLGALGAFFGGPMGIVLTLGITVIAGLADAFLKSANATADATDKLIKDAKETETTRLAKERFKATAEGVASAIRDGTEATRLSIEGMRSSAEAANIAAKQNLEQELSIRRVTSAQLEQAKVLANNAKSQNIFAGGPGGAQSQVAEQYAGRVADLEKQITEQKKLIDQAQARVGQTRIDLAAEAAARAADPMLRIKKLYDDQADAAKRAAAAQMASGQNVGVALTRELTLIERNRAAAVKAEQDKQAASNKTATEIGRNVTLAQARAIAESVGGRVTSDQRSYAEQAALYKKYQDYKAGTGPWAALAAKPGTSNHETGQAIDVAKTSGVSLESLKAAYRKAGVSLTEALNEGDHYHIAWKKVGDQAKEQTAAIAAAKRELTDAEVTEAQTKNLYELGKAYGASGGAAMIAFARINATTDALKRNGDVDASVARDVGLAIAQRVSDAAKGTASMRDQAAVQEQVNAEVAAGNVPAERAQAMLRDRMADLPLLAALEAAQKTQNVVGAQAAAEALDQQRAARERLTDAETKGRFVADMSAGEDRLAVLREELRLVGATDEARVRALATIQATQAASAQGFTGKDGAAYVAQQVEIAVATERTAAATRNLNDSLSFTADKWDLIARNVQTAAQGMADAFGSVGRAIGDMASVYANYEADRARLTQQHDDAVKKSGGNQQAIDRANQKFALASATSQIGAFGDMASAAKGFFDEKSKGYQTMLAAEKVFRAVEFALSVKAMAQDAIHTASSVAKSAIRAAASGVEAVAKAIASLPFPANIAAGAATIAALAAIGVSVVGGLGGGSKGTVVKANDGTGTVLGDSSAKSDSIKNAVDALKEVDTLTNTFARQMAASLRSIDSQIGNVASLVSRAGDVNASAGVTEGFKPNLIGSVLSKIPLIGGLLGSLFGSTTTVTGSGLYGGAQSIGSILGGGFNAQYYSDVEKKSKFFGIVTGTKTSTHYTGADATLQNQFTLILKQFNDSIVAAAGPLGSATSEIQNRLNGFVVNIGKIDLKGLTGTEIQEKLSAVFGAAADNMANAAFPGIERFQRVGDGAFETLVRVASTVEAVTNAMDQLGAGAQALGIDAKMGLANQFASISDLTSAVDGYFQAFYTSEEQATAKQAQLARVFGSLGVAMPGTLAAFRSLVEAQDLTTAAGQSTYATLLQLAPAFADLQKSMEGAKSAADIASERNDLQRQLLTLQGNTAAIRALDLAKIDSSNRALQEQVWAIQDEQDAAKAADELRAAWTSVGDSIMDEVKRIRGLTGTNGGTSFVSLMGQFNAATAAARGGDQDAAKSLPQLSQSLLAAAALVATSRQELDRVQAQTAASLEATNAAISNLATTVTPTTSVAAILANAATVQASTTPVASNGDMASELRSLRDELAQLRADNNAGHAATASNTGSLKRSFDSVTAASGGEAISVASAA
ncbi:D-alanyl-D-alanine carboxypeptidase family protein [Sphingomonas sp. TREG-RG-20F-R18-01]|uniref:D-alanyl-D-alanine carboxypeptidase family protein n=1 Tax=Sphingomonas sp. TREG-RG-20F-R18-01 TaxID=2914982 RepID=UPI001F573643|nr:D-alanyl-D-alanine carboxypeptidase family protein [Sphingomonas sp. TREG-RG-20F-R18-01]